MFPGLIRNKKDQREKEEAFFVKNGASVLEKLVSLLNGDCNPIRSYSAQQLQKATGDFRWLIHEGWNYNLYKGIHEEREISVKRFTSDCKDDDVLEKIANEVAIASRMSNHKNVLKLLGCCLETELPLLVYEFPALGNLGNHIYRPKDNQLPWELKLRIVTEVANAVAYLHYGLSRTIIHRNIKPINVFLDRNHVAKLFDFQDALPIPVGDSHIDAQVMGTFGFVAPEIAENGVAEDRGRTLSNPSTVLAELEFNQEKSSDGRYTEKSDVYSFGVLLLEVLVGDRSNIFIWDPAAPRNSINFFPLPGSHKRSSNSSYQTMDFCSGSSVRSDNFYGELVQEDCKSRQQEENRISVNSKFQIEAFHAKILEEYCEFDLQEENRTQVMEYVNLVRRCVKANPVHRPDMIEIGKRLGLIKNI
ncbi:hypothetical protein TIFTF001_005913 [Ficus carica]|uniref:Protein kinase domain-containing protein n=1 Tax=Ficus carica TaxID=3494 RepID=A0AA88A2W4_FICCA|nr:hypothetical protein TIFTF001_005913 [Ficus carica]